MGGFRAVSCPLAARGWWWGAPNRPLPWGPAQLEPGPAGTAPGVTRELGRGRRWRWRWRQTPLGPGTGHPDSQSPPEPPQGNFSLLPEEESCGFVLTLTGLSGQGPCSGTGKLRVPWKIASQMMMLQALFPLLESTSFLKTSLHGQDPGSRDCFL